MIDKSFIEKIESMAETKILDLEGDRQYSTKPLHPVIPPTPDILEVSTLTAVVDYLDKNRDGLDMAKTIVHIEQPCIVRILTALQQPWMQRAGMVRAMHSPKVFPFGRYLPVEEFIVALQTYFIPTETTGIMTKIVGNLSAETSVKVLDDGVSQEVQARSGISMVKDTPLPNPVTLKPYRTFMEVTQPASQFLFRMKKEGGIGCALFEADGGNWQLEAVANIREWLKDKIPAEVIIIA